MMRRTKMLTFSALAGLSFLTFGSVPCWAQFGGFNFGNLSGGDPQSPTETSFIRQFAKDKPFTYIVCSGKTATVLGDFLKNAVYSHPDGKNTAPGKIKVVALSEMEDLQKKPEWTTANRVFLLNESEMEKEFPASLRSLLPEGAEIKPTLAWSGAKRIHDLGGPGLQHTVLLAAPDDISLARLLIRFMKRTATNGGKRDGIWKNMQFEETHPVNHIIVYSPAEIRADIQAWGNLHTVNPDDSDGHHKDALIKALENLAGTENPEGTPGAVSETWQFTEWKPFAKIGNTETAMTQGCSRIYFVDRSDFNVKAKLPEDIGAIAYDANLDVLDSCVEKKEDLGKITNVIFSAPNSKMLVGISGIYPNVDRVPQEPVRVKSLDLRFITSIGLAIQGNDLNEKKRETLHAETASSMRQDLLLPVDIRTAFYRDVAADAPVEDVINYFGLKYDLDYVCILNILEYDGKTKFDHRETKLTPDVRPWTELPPTVGTGKNAGRAYADAISSYQARHQQWETRYREDCSWERELIVKTSAHVRGHIMLLRVSDPTPLWEHEVDYNYEPPAEVIQTEAVVVHGHDRQPDSMPTPVTQPVSPPDMMFKAVKEAAHQACINLQGSARLMLPGETAKKDPSILSYRRDKPYHTRSSASSGSGQSNIVIATRGSYSRLTEAKDQEIIVELSAQDARQVKVGSTGRLHSGENATDAVVMAVKVNKILPAKPGQPVRARCEPVRSADAAKIKKEMESAHGLVEWDSPKPKPKPHHN